MKPATVPMAPRAISPRAARSDGSSGRLLATRARRSAVLAFADIGHGARCRSRPVVLAIVRMRFCAGGLRFRSFADIVDRLRRSLKALLVSLFRLGFRVAHAKVWRHVAGR